MPVHDFLPQSLLTRFSGISKMSCFLELQQMLPWKHHTQTQLAWLKPVLQIKIIITDINFMFPQLSTGEGCFSSCHEHGTKKKLWVSMRNQTSDLQIPCSNALSLSHRDYSEGGLLWSSVWHTSCTLLGSAMSIISCLYIEYLKW